MSYDTKSFSVLAYANGFTLWNYSTTDTLETVKTAKYFNETAPFVRVGDMILVNASTSGTLETAILVVSANAEGTVSVSQVAGPVVDTE